MKYNKILVVILFIVFILFNFGKYKIENFKKQNHFKLVVTFYNPGKSFLEKCLASIENQNYKNYHLCLFNDASTKEVDELDNISKKYCKRNNWIYFKNIVNKGPCYSRIKAIELLNPKDEDIIILIDGDDKLNNINVLNILNNKYKDDTLITFGNFVKVNIKGERKSNKRVKCHRLNIPELAKQKKFRNLDGNKYPFSHLKTFKYKLYKNLDLDDLKKDGEYIKSATDAALMYPLLEMAGKNIKCVQEVLYDYTMDHSESFHNNTYKKIKQKENLRYVQGLRKYDVLDENKPQKFNIYYINLEKRKDRRKRIETELKKLKNIKNTNFNVQRFNAIKSDIHGGIGCGKSHINILKLAKQKNLPWVVIIEDDIAVKDLNLNNYFKIIHNIPDWDVFILSGHGKSKKYGRLTYRCLGIQTTGWYIVKQHYYDKLIDVFSESVNNMERLYKEGKDIEYETWAIDQNWKKLQRKDNWLKFKDNLGFQREDYSDILNEQVDYTEMLH